jgi:hypothetical protein
VLYLIPPFGEKKTQPIIFWSYLGGFFFKNYIKIHLQLSTWNVTGLRFLKPLYCCTWTRYSLKRVFMTLYLRVRFMVIEMRRGFIPLQHARYCLALIPRVPTWLHDECWHIESQELPATPSWFQHIFHKSTDNVTGHSAIYFTCLPFITIYELTAIQMV